MLLRSPLDRRGIVFLALVIGAAVVVPVLALATPPDSALHLSP